MNIVEIIQKDEPNFTGICVREGETPLEKVRGFGIAMAWLFNKWRVQQYIGKKILVAGHAAYKGKYFIATIKNIITVRQAAESKDFPDAIANNDKLYGNWIDWWCTHDKPNNPVDERCAIIFHEAEGIKYFSQGFSFARGGFYYVHAPKKNTSIPLPNIENKQFAKTLDFENAPLSRITELYLRGFKDPEREVTITFSEEAITVIHGENGSGKTTLLRVIQAILKKDIAYLKNENVKAFKLTFLQGENEYVLAVNCENIDNPWLERYNNDNDMPEIYEILATYSRSVFLGLNRGVVETNQSFMENMEAQLSLLDQLAMLPEGRAKQILDSLRQQVDKRVNSLSQKSDIVENHVIMDDFSIQRIEKDLRTTYRDATNAVIQGMNNAFLQTIGSLFTSEHHTTIPPDFAQRFTAKKTLFQSVISGLEDSLPKDKLRQFVDSDAFDSISAENTIFQSLVVNMLKQAEKNEKEDIGLKAINEVIKRFNTFLIDGKKLVLDAVEAKIVFPHPNKAFHQLSELSSGERHLLSLLTIFLITGRESNVFLIDEPEISLSMAWQRELLPLLSEFAPQAQIIVATHSPEIPFGNKKYLRRLK